MYQCRELSLCRCQLAIHKVAFINSARSFWDTKVFGFWGKYSCKAETKGNIFFYYRKYLAKKSGGKFLNEEIYKLNYIVENCEFGDWYILMQLSKYIQPGIFREFITDLRSEMLRAKEPPKSGTRDNNSRPRSTPYRV